MQEHAIIISGTSDPFVLQSSVQILSYIETPVMWCPILLENKVCSLSLKQKFQQPILQHSKVRFTVDRCSFKKEGPYTLLRYGAKHVHLRRISHMLLYCLRMFSSPYACVVFVDFASYVEGCFVTKTRRSSNLSSSNITCIWVQKSSRADLSVSFKCWSKSSL